MAVARTRGCDCRGGEGGEGGGEEKDDEKSIKSDFHVEVEDVDAKKNEPQRGRTRPEEIAARARDEFETGSSATRSSRRKSRGGLTREKLAILPNEAAPIGMLANLSLKKARSSRSRKSSRSRSVSTVDSNEFGVANDDYFRASSMFPAYAGCARTTTLNGFAQVLARIAPLCMRNIKHPTSFGVV